MAGGVLGGFIGRAVTPGVSKERIPRWVVPAAGVAAVAVMAWAIPMPNGNPPKATLALTPAKPLGRRAPGARDRQARPAERRRGRRWFVVTAWQGKRRSIVGEMKKVGPGVYRADKPVPIGGPDWKATLRLQRGRAVLGLPLYLPADKAIPVKQVVATNGRRSEFVRDKSAAPARAEEGRAGLPDAGGLHRRVPHLGHDDRGGGLGPRSALALARRGSPDPSAGARAGACAAGRPAAEYGVKELPGCSH